MSYTPLVSVLMPTFNAEKYVGEAINSILSQSFQDFEFIIINDGSTDNTSRILEQYKALDPRIQVYHQANSGVANSMSRGCLLAKGKYIARMDADDISLPQRLVRQIEFLERRTDIGICGTWMCVGSEAKEYTLSYPTDPDIARSMLPFQLSVAAPSIMFVREMYLRTGVRHNPNVGATDDYLFVVDCSKYCRLSSLPEVLYFYRLHPAQVTKREEDRQSKFTRQIRLMQLEELGLRPSEAELNVHEAISSWRLTGGKNVIVQAEAWLLKLKQANALRLLYPEPAFTQVLSNYWFSLCTRHAKLGFWTYRRYSQWPLSREVSVSLGKRMKLLIKCIAGYGRNYSFGVAE